LTALAVALVAMVVLCVAASAAQRSTVTLNLEMVTTDQPAFEVLVANFERVYPNIQINATYTPSGTYAPLLATQLQAGNGPDLMYTVPGTGGAEPVLTMAKNGYLANLAGQPGIKRLPKEILPLVQVDKGIYTWPLDVYAFGMTYNKDIFAKYNIKIPTTFSQLLSICTQLVNAGQTPMGFTGGVNTIAAFYPLLLSPNDVYAKNPYWNTQRMNHQVTFAGSAGWTHVYEQFQQMQQAKCFGPGAAGNSYADVLGQMATGQVAMFGGLTSTISGMLAINPKANIGMFPFPGDTAGLTRVGFASNGLAANAHSAHLKEALTFIQFMARPKQSTLFAKVNQSVAPWDWDKGEFPPLYDLLKPLITAHKITPVPNVTMSNPNVYITLGTVAQGIFTGQTTVAGGLQALDTAWGG
jgi:raffinose/stachyose/melibiose transport system substrate-binding protein